MIFSADIFLKDFEIKFAKKFGLICVRRNNERRRLEFQNNIINCIGFMTRKTQSMNVWVVKTALKNR